MKDVKTERMRLDRFFSMQNIASRKDALRLIRKGAVKLNGSTVKNPGEYIAEDDVVTFGGKDITYKKHLYIMMNKPAGVLSASRDPKGQTVVDLLPDKFTRRGLFPAGRLDKDTTGLMIITDDGKYAHDMLSPKKHVYKIYRALLEHEIQKEDIAAFLRGIEYKGVSYAPAFLSKDAGCCASVRIREGKYHQVKRMFEACGNHVEALTRLKIGGLALDSSLEQGEARLMDEEEAMLAFRQ